MTMTPFEAYSMFTGLKLHFSSDYDFVRYNGKTRVTETSFDTKRDKYHYVKLSKHKNPKLLCISNLYEQPNLWIGNLFNPSNEKLYKERKGVWDSLEHTVKTDLARYDTLDDAFVVDNDYPNLYKDFRAKRVAPETLIIANMVCGIFKYWNEEINDNILWPNDRRRLEKLGAFLDLNRDKYRDLMVDIQS